MEIVGDIQKIEDEKYTENELINMVLNSFGTVKIIYSDKEPNILYLQDEKNIYIPGAIRLKLKEPIQFPQGYLSLENIWCLDELKPYLDDDDQGELANTDINNILLEKIKEENIKIIYKIIRGGQYDTNIGK